MRRILAAILAILALASGAQASVGLQTITLWDFQDHYWSDVWQDWIVEPEYTPEIGEGSWEAQGVAVWDPDEQDYRDPENVLELNSSSDPIHEINEFMGYALDFDNSPAQGTGNKTAGARFNVSTKGYTGIVISFDIRHKYRSPRHARVQYTVDGVNWIDSAVFEADNPNEADHWYNGRTVDLSGIPGVSDNPNFAFRVVAEFGPSGGYEASKSGAVYRQRDNFRFDMVRVSGIPIGTPRAYLISNRDTRHEIISTAKDNFLFSIWGRVSGLDGGGFTLDDGSGAPVRVLAQGVQAIAEGDYAKATGSLDNSGGTVVLRSSAAQVEKLD